MSTAQRPAASQRQIEELIFAVVIAALGVFVLLKTGDIFEPPTNKLGPRVVPYIVGTGLAVLGGLLVIQVLRGKLGAAEESEDFDADASTNWITVGLLIAVLLIHSVLISPLGWPIAAAFLFAGGTFILGGRRIVATVAIAIALALLLQFLFAHVLGIGLPAGPGLDQIGIFNG